MVWLRLISCDWASFAFGSGVVHSNIVVSARRTRCTIKVVIVLPNGARAVAFARVTAGAPLITLGAIERGFQKLMACATLDTAKLRVCVRSIWTRSGTPQWMRFVKARAVVKFIGVTITVVSSLDTMSVR